MANTNETIVLINYGAGNVRSLVNAVTELGYSIKIAETPNDILLASKVIFPGVGAFGSAVDGLKDKQFQDALRTHIHKDKPYLGICVGMQVLFEESEESPGVKGLAILPGTVKKFNVQQKSVPHMGWNKCKRQQSENKNQPWIKDTHYYFVHSYAVMLPLDTKNAGNYDWVCGLTCYQDECFVSAIRKGNMLATQFHPEKSGKAGLELLKSFLDGSFGCFIPSTHLAIPKDGLTKRIIACLDVRANDYGDLVVTKGDQYHVREKNVNQVRNLGKPVEMAKKYYTDGADEITFLNITSFKNCPLKDTPMLEVLKQTSKTVFVPLTVGGGIREVVMEDGTTLSALQVAGAYFESGADKVSIGSDAVYATELFLKNSCKLTNTSCIELISQHYGVQAVVISVDPKRVYVNDPKDAPTHTVINTKIKGPNGEQYCWYQCTVKGGREARDIDVIQLVTSCQAMGAGEILLNCMDKDGTKSGYDHELIRMVKKVVTIPVIASSGAGALKHFSDVFKETGVDAALAAGIFHRDEIPLQSVKKHLSKNTTVPVRDSTA